MKKIFLLLFFLLLPIFGNASEAPATLNNAVDAALKDDLNKFIPELIKGSSLEGAEEVKKINGAFKAITELHGKFEGFDLISEKILSKRIRLVYFVLYFDGAPIYGVAEAYKRNNVETIKKFDLNGDVSEILPAHYR